jgi:hypothetical protein
MTTSLSSELPLLFMSHTRLRLGRGFAAQASTKALETVQALGAQYLPVIEEDSIVSIDGELISGGHTN